VTEHTAFLLRKNTGTLSIEDTARVAVRVLAHLRIPHLIIGGLAVQEHGYYRVTLDVDIVVPDVLEAVELVTSDLSGPFARVSGVEDRIRDKRNEVFVDFLPAGRVVKRGCQVPFPKPTVVTEQLQIVGKMDLISLKLDSWQNSPTLRLRDKTDVVELILRCKLPRDLNVVPAVRESYVATWDALKAEL
jgi:hypothetical protein